MRRKQRVIAARWVHPTRNGAARTHQERATRPLTDRQRGQARRRPLHKPRYTKRALTSWPRPAGGAKGVVASNKTPNCRVGGTMRLLRAQGPAPTPGRLDLYSAQEHHLVRCSQMSPQNKCQSSNNDRLSGLDGRKTDPRGEPAKRALCHTPGEDALTETALHHACPKARQRHVSDNWPLQGRDSTRGRQATTPEGKARRAGAHSLLTPWLITDATHLLRQPQP